jgi:hypothetical protein
VYYIHTDQLNTPRQITRPSDNAPMWTWFSDPFGTDAANPNPAGAGTFAYNLRFPGQIFDGQAGLHQNRRRDFDPVLARTRRLQDSQAKRHQSLVPLQPVWPRQISRPTLEWKSP